MWVWGDDLAARSDGKSVLLDWEMVGVGSGPQDLAQYLISHMDPVLRRDHEHDLVTAYYQELVATTTGEAIAAEYSFADCWKDYQSGLERWVWLLAVLSTMCPDNMIQYFQNQVAAFIHDHNIGPDTIGMPRV